MVKDARARLSSLRQLMRERNIGVYVVPSGDAHSSEYLAPCDARRAWLTGFTGSAGLAVVTQTEALCWTDGRYFLQAGKELSSDWTLMKAGLPETPTWTNWLKDLGPTTRVGVDPTVISEKEAAPLATALGTDPTRALVPIKDNLVDAIWDERPPRPANPAFRLGDEYAGQSVGDKILALREKLAAIGSPGLVVSALDEVAWLFNLRGSDIPYNPVFFSYAIVTRHDTTLFANPASITPEVKAYLQKNNVAVLDYEKVWQALDSWKGQLSAERAQKDAAAKEAAAAAERGEVAKMPASEPAPPKKEEKKDPKIVKTDKVLIGNSASWAIADALGKDNCEVRRSLVEDAKARKNATEIEGFRRAHIRDGAALCRYFAWLEEVLAKGEQWSEFDAATQLENFRKENKLFMGLSFDTISSTGPNAAVIHYSPSETESATIDPKQIYLCDSGAQYMDGTTDTTRTVHFGTPSAAEKRAFTRVLQGHIALDTAVFPTGTTGYLLDALARRPLWMDGLDYRHGTGHGVGHFLNVHEGPQGVGPRPAYNEIGLAEGMVISNEPGYYEDGAFGIRTESVVAIRHAATPHNFGDKGYLEFENFTTVPIQTSLIQLDLLSPAEREWLNAYHADVLAKVRPELEGHGDERAIAWLKRQCVPV
ncbi:Creatinase/aminopeptidase [Cutaneotrichosporon oleaginosum]|uniref:Creatinase/aminopeptidase n=1 Tax=Cutaneotrichosporon oleaginosum TaxID=879819 RepID=A0A0J0XHV2_9TREE|nr:Creatinase/aminopeptidase [Cutaneotrichosporon oleaginosum]KLT40653.1 Creatinase/aminopeptidase [Cutaneotrichosporon oleaginosum]TXT12463.1 hypothetical protein COLE_02873 [Cutaneotrichosporon oleaginosum]